ncbi:MAG: hypothetical protein AB7O96_02375 [Pseudobdellovibrionaceae bacterium]
MIEINRDAWSDGQMGSKIWLAETLESFGPQFFNEPQRIWILGGWYGLLGQVLFVRERLNIARITSIDIDPDVRERARAVNNRWECQGRFHAVAADCNYLSYENSSYGEKPNLVINTSCEHFDNMKWWKRIPEDTWVVLQSTNMEHESHINRSFSIEQFQSQFPEMKQVIYAQTLKFEYPGFKFERYMLIGKK